MARPGDTIENPRIGARMVFLRTGRETGGQLMEADLFVRPGNKAPPKHIHPLQDPLQFAVTMWSFRSEGTFPGIMKFLLAAMAGLGKALGYKPDYPYPYGKNP